MASSRSSRPAEPGGEGGGESVGKSSMGDACERPLSDVRNSPLDDLRTSPLGAVRVALAGLAPGDRVLVAFSGGLDSSVLLDAVVQCRAPATVLAWHVNHGLQAQADGWREHCETVAAALGTGFGATALVGRPARGESLEEWARHGRYAALRAAAADAGAAAVLTAHHADDQVETVLMRLARGTGLEGASGMAERSWLGAVPLLRPLLGLSRAEIAAWAQSRDLRWVEDPSNVDTRRLRNAVRHEVLPILDHTFPGFRRNLLRSVAHWRASAETLAELIGEDLAAVALCDAVLGECLSRARWQALPAPRRDEVLRAWLARHGCRAPPSARLAEMSRQLARCSADSGVALAHDGCCLRLYRDFIALERPAVPAAGAVLAPGAAVPVAFAVLAPRAAVAGDGYRFRWTGQASLETLAPPGTLEIEPVVIEGALGLPGALLRDSELTLGYRRGGERLRVAAHRPTRSLKNLFQERGVPPWRRDRLPVLRVGGDVLWVAALGANAQFLVSEGERVALAWHPADRFR